MSQESTVKLPPYNRNLILEVVLLYKCTQFNYMKIHHLLLCNALQGNVGMAGHKSSFSCAKQLNEIWIRSLLFRGQIKFWPDPLLSLSPARHCVKDREVADKFSIWPLIELILMKWNNATVNTHLWLLLRWLQKLLLQTGATQGCIKPCQSIEWDYNYIHSPVQFSPGQVVHRPFTFHFGPNLLEWFLW